MIIDTVNWLISLLFDALSAPLVFFDASLRLVILSALVGVVFLLAYGRVSNQKGIRRIKDRIQSDLLAAVLYRHDLRVSLAAQLRMLKGGVVYFFYAIGPLLILMIPMLLVLAQFHFRFGWQGLSVGDEVVVRVRVAEETLDRVALSVPPEVEISTPALRVASMGEVLWRVRALKEGTKVFHVELGSMRKSYEKSLSIGDSPRGISSLRSSAWWWTLLYPGESHLESSEGLLGIEVLYPEQRYSFLGMKMHWIFVFIIVSVLSALVGSRIFRVEI